MPALADFPSAPTSRDKVVTAAEAVRLIRDGDSVAIEGFGGQCFPEELTIALEQRFLESGSPRGLGIIFTVAQGDRRGRGLDRICHPGLIDRAVGGHWGMSPGIQKLAVGNEIAAHNLPQGVLSQLFRDTAAGKPGLLTHVGLGTFVDPRFGGGKVNERTTEDLVELITLGGKEFLFYKALPLDVALLRGTTADPDGNITMEREALTLEVLPIATAVHNAGGLVIVQVERLADAGSLSPREVKIPGVLVDCVVLAERDHHWQTFGTPYSPAYSGELRRVPLHQLRPLPLTERKLIARRAALELRANSVVNLGVGMPEGVAAVATEERIVDYLTLTAEPGVIGGMPAGGADFGVAVNAQAVLDQPYQFDFYDGGGLDAAFLGMAQSDRDGNVNVSRFGARLAGSGGFINISQNAKQVLFLGTFLAPSRTTVVDGRLIVDQEPAAAKFVEAVEQRTFSGAQALRTGQPVLYITDRCVFRLTAGGLQLTEIAPGIDIERDILAHMPFKPIIDGDPAVMDARILAPEPMGLKDQLLSVPMAARMSYDAARNVFFLNMEGLAPSTPAEVETLRAAIESRLAAVGRKVHLVANYDNFTLPDHLRDLYAHSIQDFADRFYLSVSRYSTSSFMRLKLHDHLASRGVAPHIYENRAEALANLGAE
ncbi:acyl CoA:acetate/3-ketoacid CoA transferase [Nocardia sp. NEAU-G5]|uniref:Acyl CoA:acetate/3-ketoacid CoA transferase n=1 Tax=Nocardia albiluteola TaxID=2842303 RepID=A0ABS6B3R8_9NOCA|nr:acyl CoA:acetate/3-ketoacid CoA transferase [Nocardia albiluteola]MBU3064941.1 acyl CoA:acetate/3-ketoacid CoA transferase [Nocardia albiluteola]